MKIYIGADHNGFEFKKQIITFLSSSGYQVFDDGNQGLDQTDDFPQFATRVVSSLLADKDQDSRGILICASGQGMCMAANRHKGVRASLCWNLEEARSARNDDDSNVLCLSSKYLSLKATEPIIITWLNTQFAGASRFKRRIQELDNLS
ncbi:MAG: RpiB/LacA/LacB family sugar-phosphate isomerase [Candidatus Saccharimonadales bacterium]